MVQRHIRLQQSLTLRVLPIIALLLLFVALAAPVKAAGPALFTEDSAEADFPETLTFNVVVETDGGVRTVELYWRPAATNVLTLEIPEFEPAERVTIRHVVDMTISYLPPGLDITWFWRVTDDAGVVSESQPQTMQYMDERHDWRTLSDGLVTLYWYDGSDEFADDLVETANRTINLLDDRFDVAGSEEIRLVIYGSNADFNEALPPNSAEWIGGQAYSDLRLIIAALDPGPGSDSEIRRMVPHEVSHLIVYQATQNPFNAPPNWLDEGLAVYNQETKDPRFAPLLEDAVREGRLIPVRALNSSFPLDPEEALLSYAESESIVTFIIDRWGDEGIARLLGSFREELSYDEAVLTSLDVTLDELDTEWKAWLDYPGDAPPEAPDTVAETDDDLTQTEMRVFVGVGIGVIACLVIFGITAFVLAYRAHRGPQSSG